jgi:hypothetical protein
MESTEQQITPDLKNQESQQSETKSETSGGQQSQKPAQGLSWLEKAREL